MDQEKLRQLGSPDKIKNELTKQFTQQIEEDSLEQDESVIKVKLVVVGPKGAGKTSWVTSLIQNKFVESQQPTIGAKFSSQGVAIDSVVYNFEIWDVSGEDWCKSLVPMYLQYAQACVVVYDATSSASFQEAQDWVDYVQELQPDKLIICLVGMKHDLSFISALPVQPSHGQEFFKQKKLEKDFLFPEVSAKSGENVQDVILTLAEAFHERGLKAPRESVLDGNNSGYDLGNTKAQQKTLGRVPADPNSGNGNTFGDKLSSCLTVFKVYAGSCFQSSKETTKKAAEKTNTGAKEIAIGVKRQSMRFGGQVSRMSLKLKHKATLIKKRSMSSEFVAEKGQNQAFDNVVSVSKPSEKPTVMQIKA